MAKSVEITAGMAKCASFCQHKISEAHVQKIQFSRSKISRWKTEGRNKWGMTFQIDEKKKN